MYDIILGRTQKDTEKLGTKGTVLIGKQYVNMGQTTSLSNPIHLDVSRAHAILICGKRGGGKCVAAGTDIVLDDGRVLPIEQLEHDNSNPFTMDIEYKLRPSKKEAFYKRKVKELYILTLRSGKQLKITGEHPLLTVNSWKAAQDCEIGERIATPRKIPVEGNKSLGQTKTKLLAYLIAEGHLGNGFVLFSNADPVLKKDFEEEIKRYDESLCCKEHDKFTYRVVQKNPKKDWKITQRDKKGRITSINVTASQSSLKEWMNSLSMYGVLAKEKILPQCIFTLPNDELRLFLQTLFSCDGSIYQKSKDNPQISYSTSSRKMAEQISHLLLRFEILCKIRDKNIRYEGNELKSYELIINGQSCQNYLEKIGFYGEKAVRASKYLSYYEKDSYMRNPNLDTIPQEFWERYQPRLTWTEIGKAFKYKYPKSMRESTRYSPSRQKLKRIAELDENQEAFNLATSDVYWDEISHIEKMVGNFTVYDISMPDYHNFIANDIIIHNSYTMGSIAEGLFSTEQEIKKNLSFLLFDTMGAYWSMKYPNKKEEDLLKKWNLEGQGLDIVTYTPGGFFKKYQEDGVPVDFPFYIKPSELSAEDWLHAFRLGMDDSVGVGVQRTITKLLKTGNEFGMEDIINTTENDERMDDKTKFAVSNRFINAQSWGIFSKKGTPIKDILGPGSVTILDLSPYVAMPGGWEIRSLVLGIVAKKIFVERMLVRKREELAEIKNRTQILKEKEVKEDIPMPWLIVDEAHEFLPDQGKTPASQALMTILREGRQPGVSLIMATQQPGKIHTDAITQSDIVMSHRITASFDLEALDKIFLSYESKGSKALFNSMPRVKGCAIIMDDKNERLHTMQVKPRISWHGGEDPNAIREVKDEFDLEEF